MAKKEETQGKQIVKVKVLRKCFMRTHPRAPAERQVKPGAIIQIYPEAFSSRFMRVMNPDHVDICLKACRDRDAEYKSRHENPRMHNPYGLGHETDDILLDGGDLTLVDGVGPTLKANLKDHDIDTIQHLVDAEDDLLVEVEGISRMNVGRIKTHARQLLEGVEAPATE